MNRIEPPNRFSAEAVRKHEGDGDKSQPGQLNETARQVAAQYRRDTMSPVMVSGVLRIVELALLVLSGATLFVYYVGLGTDLDWHYPAVIAGASLLAVILLDITDCYQLAALMRPVSNVGTHRDRVGRNAGALRRRRLLPEARRRFFARLVRRLVRGRARRSARAAARARAHDQALGAQRQDRAARRHRRRRQGCRGADPLGRAAALQRHPHLRHLRRPRRPPFAAARRRLSQARHHLRTDRVRPHRPHRHADRVAAADGRRRACWRS